MTYGEREINFKVIAEDISDLFKNLWCNKSIKPKIEKWMNKISIEID